MQTYRQKLHRYLREYIKNVLIFFEERSKYFCYCSFKNKPRDPIHAVNVKLGSRLLNSMNTTQQNRVPRADNYIKCQNDEYEGVLNNESNVPERSNTNNDSSNVPTSSNDETKESDIKKVCFYDY